MKNQTPGKCGGHLRQSNPFAKNPRFLYQTSLQDLSPSLFPLVLISRNNTSFSFPFSLRSLSYVAKKEDKSRAKKENESKRAHRFRFTHKLIICWNWGLGNKFKCVNTRILG
ncbi:hypothetical protein SO802_012967 [Lithocarpus litseifolius]|uniref:Uncharacterized protein n=1 Tax=Lithocarpus litseifolius TaxID=425828 RepID=A0AAW2D9R5_9ROSI